MSAGAWTLLVLGAGFGAVAASSGRRARRRNAAQAEPTPPRRLARARPADVAALRRRELLGLHVAAEPRPCKFYQLQPGDTPYTVSRRALGSVGRHTAAHVLEYWRCVTSCQYNLGIWGGRSTTKRYPAELLAPGIGLGIRVAFLPRNEDALRAMAMGSHPQVCVDKDGAELGLGESLGAPWLPHVDREALADGEVTCRTYSWGDGTSSLEPDPELIALLE